MEALWLGVGILFAIGVGFARWRRRRLERRQLTRHTMRCPISGETADVALETDPAARAQYVGVQSCSLLSRAAFDLPERVAYLWDGPPCRVRMEPARALPVYTADIACSRDCVDVLNATASGVLSQPLRCSSGASDAMALAEQALGPSRVTRLLWYASF